MLQGIISKVKNYLSKTSDKINSGLSIVFKNKKLDSQALQELKEILIAADVDYKTASSLVEELSVNKFNKEVTEKEVKSFLAERIIKILLPLEGHIELKHSPQVVMLCGVNGNGKTTTTAKLAYQFKKQGKKVLVAPCDTFRAAAEEQLAIWAQKIGCEIFSCTAKDPASIAYQAVIYAQQNDFDVLIIDTAGRLHNNASLMNELKKIATVVGKLVGEYPIALVLDATVGQNAYNQITLFKDLVNVDGIIVTKLDGTAKAGVIIGIANQFENLKLYSIGVGESLEDLQDFSAKNFTYSLLGIDEE